MTTLFDPIQVGSIHASNRIWMAPLTRGRADEECVPTPLMKEYYTQRSDAGIIITEAIGVSREGLGWPYAPGLWTDKQVEGWKPIVEAVHAKNGKIVAQLWHMGRAVHSSVTGSQPVSSSATSCPKPLHTYDGKKDPEVARPLTKEDIKKTVKDFSVAARNAIKAGFDGVQIHGANGYLIDQFLRDSANKRTDEYGGSVENQARFMEEVVAAVVEAVGADRTAIRLSPNGETYGCIDSRPELLFTEVAKILNKYKLAFVELREIGPNGTFGSSDEPKLNHIFRKHLQQVPLVLNQDFTGDSAAEAVASGIADAIAFGRPFISNPDLVQKIKNKVKWVKDDMKTWYSRGPEGYTSYPLSSSL